MARRRPDRRGGRQRLRNFRVDVGDRPVGRHPQLPDGCRPVVGLDRARAGPVHAVARCTPAAGKVFSAVAGEGAALGAEPLSASACSRLAEAIVGLSFHPAPATKRRMGELIPTVLPAVGDIRRIPAALHLCYLAAGRFDAGVLVDTREGKSPRACSSPPRQESFSATRRRSHAGHHRGRRARRVDEFSEWSARRRRGHERRAAVAGAIELPHRVAEAAMAADWSPPALRSRRYGGPEA